MAGTIGMGCCIIFQHVDAVLWSQYRESDINHDTISLNYPSDWRVENGSSIGKRNPTLIKLYPPSDPLDYYSNLQLVLNY